MQAKLNAVSLTDSKEHRNLVVSLIDEICQPNSSHDNVKEFASALLSGSISQTTIRSGLTYLSEVLKSCPAEMAYDIGSFLLQEYKQQGFSCDEAEFGLREIMFDYLISCQQFADAAEVLCLINLESTSRPFTTVQKANNLVKIAECYLMEKEYVEADVFSTKAGAYMNEIGNDKEVHLQLRYRVVTAQVLDANRKFVDAALRYYELSNIQSTQVVSEDLLQLLGKSVTCAVLGKSGPQRSRVLGLLYKDERLSALDQTPPYTSHRAMLFKMYQEQIIKPEELGTFEAALEPHQKAITSEGLSVISVAVIEHNLLAVSKVYENIRLVDLARILHLDDQWTEKMTGRMIRSGRLYATIDQTERLLVFLDGVTGSEGSDMIGYGAKDPHEQHNSVLTQWSKNIHCECEEISECVDLVNLAFESPKI